VVYVPVYHCHEAYIKSILFSFWVAFKVQLSWDLALIRGIGGGMALD
jgi:hypothetical protein